MYIFDRDNWQEIWVTITRNKVRSFLTGFGVFWGLFMLIILVGFGNGFKGGVKGMTEGFSTNSCIFWTQRTSKPYKGYQIGRWWMMNNRDVELVRQRAVTVDALSPLIWQGGGDKNVVRGHKAGSYSLMGLYPDHFKIESMPIKWGRLINNVDIQDRRKVCLLGEEVYETLFSPGEDPIGEYVRLNGIYFQVIGVVGARSGISLIGNVSRMILLPFSTTQHMFARGDTFHNLVCSAKKGYSASQVEDEVKALIKTAHDIAPDDEKALGSFNIETEFLRFAALILGVDILIWIVGLGALFSGIIGISNIMLVTVRERMREIGVRRALGATPLRIIMQIMSESFVLTAIAGFLGFLFGVLILAGIQSAMGAPAESGIMMPPFISFNLALVAMFILMLSGLAAGLLPAMRALKIKAIDAIRDE